MATIQNTTIAPTKLELLTEWVPKQSWYIGYNATPELVKAGGFRLDDPDGEVGIEFMVVADVAAQEEVAYLVPMGYRGAALQDAPGEALIGTCEHGVLGTRWVYDGVHDPVVTAQLTALLRGEAVAQDQDESDTLDPTVTVLGTGPVAEPGVEVVRVLRAAQAEEGAPTHLVAGWTWPDGTSARGTFATMTQH
ncbi:1,4-alpha-glucan branching protein [Streptomyces olivochromogenes]|uniref:maltokinase N-terminal cap-like domain-containing protein n=1 Tax=Streptomyces olivochromogenes TaxID=1963 RepID=UPI0036DDDD6A